MRDGLCLIAMKGYKSMWANMLLFYREGRLECNIHKKAIHIHLGFKGSSCKRLSVIKLFVLAVLIERFQSRKDDPAPRHVYLCSSN